WQLTNPLSDGESYSFGIGWSGTRSFGRNLLKRGSATEHWGGTQLIGSLTQRTMTFTVDLSLPVNVAPAVAWATPAINDEDSSPQLVGTVWLRIEDPDQDVDPATVTVANSTIAAGTTYPAYYADPDQQERDQGAFGWFVCRVPFVVGLNDLLIHAEDRAGQVVESTDFAVSRHLLVPGTYPVPVVDQPYSGQVYGEGDILGLDASASVVPAGHQAWFGVLRDDGSDPMDLVYLAPGLGGSFTTSDQDPAYRARLVIATPERMPTDSELRGRDLPCTLGVPDLGCDTAEVVMQRATSGFYPFQAAYAFPDAIMLTWGTSLAGFWLDRSDDGGQTWSNIPDADNQNGESDVFYSSYRDTNVLPGHDYHYRIRDNSISLPWFYLGNTTSTAGAAVSTPIWSAPRPVPV
ncbi:MAG: hypothetical protein GY835_02835, partial [bacterium]|nr:hypothetical protein [bacterium]